MFVDTLILAAGDTDCEAFTDGWLLQPVNAFSSLVFSVAGIVVMSWARRVEGHERSLRVIFGTAMVATGVGSFLFHGFNSSVTQFLHDITFLVTIWILAVINLSDVRAWSRPIGWGIVASGAGLFSAALLIGPHITNTLTIVVSVALVGSDIALRKRGPTRTLWYWTALAAMVLAITMFVAGRTAGPLCDPTSILQGHAGWHILSGFAVAAYFVATSQARVQEGVDSR